MGTATPYIYTIPDAQATFEEFGDRQDIGTFYPGLIFGDQWTTGDWRTGTYSGKYPRGRYTSDGNIFASTAYLGYDSGRIYVSTKKLRLLVSNNGDVTLTAYNSSGQVVDSIVTGGNDYTGWMTMLEVSGDISYVIISGTVNRFLIDDVRFEIAECTIKRDEGIYSKERYCFQGEGIFVNR